MVDRDDAGAVEVKVADVTIKIERGKHEVTKLKELAGLSDADNLEQLVDGRIVPVDDTGTVKIEGGECFVVCGTGKAA